MYPETPTNPTPTDYLDQIAPQTQKSSSLFSSKPIMLGGIAIIILLIIVIALGSMSGGIKPTQRLAARLTTTAGTVEYAAGNIKSSALRALNSDLKIYLTNTIRDIDPILAKDGVKISSLDKKIMASESNTDMLARLEDARLNVDFDNTYAREMSYQLDMTLLLMKQIYTSTSSNSLKVFLTDAYANLAPTQQLFAKFNSTTN
jgi:predicted outer membrane protein